MNRFIRLGTIILNLDHVIEIRYEPATPAARYDGTDRVKDRPVLWITTSEIEVEQSSRVIRFLDDDALKVWEFLSGILNNVDGKIIRAIEDVKPV